MNYKNYRDEMEQLICKEVECLGYRYWGREIHRHGRKSVLRVYIDGEPAITLDDCVKVSRKLSESLDTHNFIAGAYDLEVSSPGIERRLFNEEQYRSYSGRCVKVRCFTAIHGRKNIVGVLGDVADDHIDVGGEGEERVYSIPYTNIRNVRLVMRDL